ncbi:hypothetical protein HMPREF0658_0827 [Acetobacter orientalis]|uniref:Uncharacterized protein n=1 Tax=Acetobacter orientalis TaxID=146474 RepID=A0A2Z5ZIQ1_9PROT|nr:hypothetical protein HMPREF0658_0827 [Acetobacter orientalis]
MFLLAGKNYFCFCKCGAPTAKIPLNLPLILAHQSCVQGIRCALTFNTTDKAISWQGLCVIWPINRKET